jgi:hypothetical protein
MIKLLDLIKEGLGYDKNQEIYYNPNNTTKDLLHLNNPNNTKTIGDLVIYYTFDYNNDRKGIYIKPLADKVKELNGIDKETLKPAILYTIKGMLNGINWRFKKVCYLDSTAGLSKTIAEIIKEEYSNVDIFPLNKIVYPKWEDMLVDDYKNKIKSPKVREIAEDAAKKMFEGKLEGEGAKIRSSHMKETVRQYFKPKYYLDDLIEPDILFVDDNFQTGTDYNSILSHYPKNQRNYLRFYAAIRLPKSSKKTDKEIAATKGSKTKLTEPQPGKISVTQAKAQDREQRMLAIINNEPTTKNLLNQIQDAKSELEKYLELYPKSDGRDQKSKLDNLKAEYDKYVKIRRLELFNIIK